MKIGFYCHGSCEFVDQFLLQFMHAQSKFYGQAERAISTGKLTHYCAYTSSLSNR